MAIWQKWVLVFLLGITLGNIWAALILWLFP